MPPDPDEPISDEVIDDPDAENHPPLDLPDEDQALLAERKRQQG